MMASWTILPGSVANNTATALPNYAPPFVALKQVLVQTEASGGTASTTSPTLADIVTSIPSGGLTGHQFYLDPSTQEWQYGSDTDDGTVLTLDGWEYGELSQIS